LAAVLSSPPERASLPMPLTEPAPLIGFSCIHRTRRGWVSVEWAAGDRRHHREPGSRTWRLAGALPENGDWRLQRDCVGSE
jgi:hypothetical protein